MRDAFENVLVFYLFLRSSRTRKIRSRRNRIVDKDMCSPVLVRVRASRQPTTQAPHTRAPQPPPLTATELQLLLCLRRCLVDCRSRARLTPRNPLRVLLNLIAGRREGDVLLLLWQDQALEESLPQEAERTQY